MHMSKRIHLSVTAAPHYPYMEGGYYIYSDRLNADAEVVYGVASATSSLVEKVITSTPLSRGLRGIGIVSASEQSS